MSDLPCNATLLEFERLVQTGAVNEWRGELRTGVDLGTANIVLAVVDEANRPIAGATYASTVVRDGIVVDYMGAVRIVRELKSRLEQRLGATLRKAAGAIPPGVVEGSVKAIGNVITAADFTLTDIADEPTAAAAVLGISDGAVVDVGGGTTGVSILQGGKVVFTGDEPTGGAHMTLVLAGAMNATTEQAEALKKDGLRERDVFPIIRPVAEKMCSIVGRMLAGFDVKTVYVVGGACSFADFAPLFERQLGIKTIKPAAPLLVTPLGIAYICGS